MNEQCKDCMFWKPVSPSAPHWAKCCHHLIDTCTRKKVVDGICLSRKEGVARSRRRDG